MLRMPAMNALINQLKLMFVSKGIPNPPLFSKAAKPCSKLRKARTACSSPSASSS
ncbi:hypothetical protein D3C81_2055500 [compost metagenome]